METTAPGAATLKQSTNDDAPLDAQEHADYRRAVGKLQWLTYTRPDICKKELHETYNNQRNIAYAR